MLLKISSQRALKATALWPSSRRESVRVCVSAFVREWVSPCNVTPYMGICIYTYAWYSVMRA